MMHSKLLIYFCILAVATARQRQRISRYRKPTTNSSNESTTSSEAQDSSPIEDPQDGYSASSNSENVLPYRGNFIPISIDALRNYFQQLPAPVTSLPAPLASYQQNQPLLNPYASNGYYTTPSPNRDSIPVLVKPQFFNYPSQLSSQNVNSAQIANPYANALSRSSIAQNIPSAYSDSNLGSRQLIPVPVIFDDPSINALKSPINPYFAARNDDISNPRYQPIQIPVKVPGNPQYQGQLQSPLLNYALVQQTQASQPNNVFQLPSRGEQNVAELINFARANVIGNSQISAPPTGSQAQINSYANSIEYLTSLLKANSGRDPLVYIGTTPASVTARPNGAYSPSTEVSRVSYTSDKSSYNY